MLTGMEPRGCPTPGACSCPPASDELALAIDRINTLANATTSIPEPPLLFERGMLYAFARAAIEVRAIIAARPGAAAVSDDATVERAAVTLQGLVPSISLSFARDTARAVLAEAAPVPG